MPLLYCDQIYEHDEILSSRSSNCTDSQPVLDKSLKTSNPLQITSLKLQFDYINFKLSNLKNIHYEVRLVVLSFN